MGDSRDDLGQVSRLLALLNSQTGSEIPTSAFGRLRRTATAAVRTGAGVLAGRLRGVEGLDSQVLERLVLSMGELKGIAMKMGQILSYMDTTLSPEARELLAVLQKRSQPTAFAAIERALREDFGARADALLSGLAHEPVATASIGQVHRARLETGVDVAVKVRHPGIEAAIRADFRSASIGKTFAQLLAPGSDVDEIVGEAEARFLEECDYEQEARRQSQFAEIYSSHGVLVIPAVHSEWSSKRVLTTSWHDGVGLETFVQRATQHEKNAAARALYEFYVGSLYHHGLFNADPHPGNLLFTDDGRVVVLDHGCVRAFDAATVAALAQLSNAARANDERRIRSALEALGVKKPDGPGFAVTLRLLRAFYAPVLEPGARAMQAPVSLDVGLVTRNKKSMMQLQLPGKLLFLFRIRFGLYAVLARLGAVIDWHALEAELASTSASS